MDLARLERKEAAVNPQSQSSRRPGPRSGTRAYRSPLRDAQANSTRRRMLESARDEFTANGYAGTTMAAVARRAAVSTDLLYKTFGSKIGVLKALFDLVVGGDDADVPLLERDGPQAMRAEPDQRRQLTMFAEGITAQLERIRPMDDILRSAAAVDAAAAELRSDLQLRQRRAAMRQVAEWVAARGRLRDHLSVDDAAAVLWTLTSPEVHQMFRDTWAWPVDRYTSWLCDTLASTLLPMAGDR